MNNNVGEIKIRKESREAYIRWQGIALTQLGYSINLILAFSLASIGFGVTLWGNGYKFQFWFYLFGLFLLLLSTLAGLGCTITRLIDFRKTREKASLKKNEPESQKLKTLRNLTNKLGCWTWRLFWIQLGLFLFGFICLAISIAVPIFSADFCK